MIMLVCGCVGVFVREGEGEGILVFCVVEWYSVSLDI